MSPSPATVLLSVFAALASSEPLDLSRPRELPSLDVRWTSQISATSLRIDEDIAYVMSYDRLVALDPATGNVLWEHGFSEPSFSFPSTEPLVTGTLVVVPFQSKVLVFEKKTGALRSELDLGTPILALAGPPFVALVGEGRGSLQLFRIDPAA